METFSTPQNLDLPPGVRRGRNLALVSERTEAAASADVAARAAALAAKEADLQAALATIRAAFSILGARALVILSAACAAAGFGWAVYSANGWALGAACAYSCLVFLPALYADWHKG